MAAALSTAATTATGAADPKPVPPLPPVALKALVAFGETIRYMADPKRVAEWRAKGVELVFADSNTETEKYRALVRDASSGVSVVLADPTGLVYAMQHAPLSSSAAASKPTARALYLQSVYAGCEPLIHTLRALGADTASAADKARAKQLHDNAYICRAGDVFGQTLSEYVLGAILHRERHWTELAAAQARKEWVKASFACRLLNTLTLGILGASGDIGSSLAQRAKQGFGMTVLGFCRTPPVADSKAASTPFVDEWFCDAAALADAKAPAPAPAAAGGAAAAAATATKQTKAAFGGLSDMLARCDYVVSILPHTSATAGLLNGDVLKACKPGAVLINVGRGSLIDDASLFHALNKQWVSHAVLDVFVDEPLPATSPLWSDARITVTPHVAALSWIVGAQLGRVFEAQLTRVLQGGAPLFQVDAARGY